uniref:uncharacterized protein LOC122585264 n=1 Tax=Erigeron canadensis TaxID=72917 RepID=UPI001CB8B5D0|nr:uncharacterized protein LOC122585264 [Erigeron canadensis]
MGDFNSSLNIEDNYTGSSNITTGMRDFKACVEEIEVFDINSSGLHYTWNQKPKRGNGVFKKIDRVMGNISFTDSFPSSCALFQPYRVSDHTPCILKLPSVARDRPKPFKFANFLVRKEGFLEAVKEGWVMEVKGHPMFRVVKKLRALKTPMRRLLLKQGNLHKKVELLRSEIDDVQKLLDRDPSDEDLRSKETGLLKEFRAATLDEEEFLKQKSKVKLSLGDTNSKFFHNTIKSNSHLNRIEVINNSVGESFEGGEVPMAIVQHYKNFLG